MRFSLISLLGFVACVAVGCAAFVSGDDMWLVAASTLMYVVATAAIIIGLFGQGTIRSFAVGFAVACLGYLALIYFGLVSENAGKGHLVTTRLLTYLIVTVTSAPPDYSDPDTAKIMQAGQQF